MKSGGDYLAVSIFVVPLLVVLAALLTGLVRERFATLAGSPASTASPRGSVSPYAFGADARFRAPDGVPGNQVSASATRPENTVPCIVQLGAAGATSTVQHLADPAAFEAALLAQGIPIRVVAE